MGRGYFDNNSLGDFVAQNIFRRLAPSGRWYLNEIRPIEFGKKGPVSVTLNLFAVQKSGHFRIYVVYRNGNGERSARNRPTLLQGDPSTTPPPTPADPTNSVHPRDNA